MACDDPRPPVWIPDWREPAAYSELTTRGDLAWQFLRRNAELQADWAYYASVPEFWPDGGGKTPKITGRSFDPAAPMIYYYATPPGLPDETLEEYEARMVGGSFSVTNLEDGLCRKWGVKWIASPETSCFRLEPYDDPFPVVDAWRDVLFIDHVPSGEQQYQILEEGYLLDPFSHPQRAVASIFPMDIETTDPPNSLVPIWFSLDRSLKDQIDEALAQLISLRDEAAHREAETPEGYPDPLGNEVQEVERPTRTKGPYRSTHSARTLVTALRVYDAVLSGVKHDDIQDVLARERFGETCMPKTYHDTPHYLSIARKMIESGYRTLIGLNK